MDRTGMLEMLVKHYSNGNKSQFAKLLGISAQGLSTWMKRNSFDNELIFSKCKGLNPFWLLTGTGPMLLSDSREVHSENSNNKNTNINDSQTMGKLLSMLEEKDKQINKLLEIIKNK